MKVEFAIANSGQKFSNVNYARHHAQTIADETGKLVDINHVINGNQGPKIITVHPTIVVDLNTK